MNYKIGIPGWKIGDNAFGVTTSYMTFVAQYGEPVILLPESEIRKDLDLLILPGGLDIDASRYGQIPGYLNTKTDLFKEYFDKEHLPEYIEMKTPIFGICRGHQ